MTGAPRHAAPDGTSTDASRLLARLAARGHTVAVAESLTGGLVLASLTAVPGSSAVVLGGVVAYAPEAKTSLLGVGAELLARVGPVHPEVAAQMAVGCRRLLGATFGVATTGEAGPVPASRAPVGTFYVALAGPAGIRVEGGSIAGDRERVRASATGAALTLLREAA